MNGQLSEHPLAELIQEIMVAGLSGSLRLAHERVKVAIYFEEGGIAYATSNLRTHRLSECARRWKDVALQQLTSARANVPDMQLGLELVARGELSREEFEELLVRQAAEVLQPALLWTSGTWDFDPRVRLTVEVKSRVEVRELLIECARRLSPEFIAKRFSRAGTEEKLSPISPVTNGLKLLPSEGFILSRVDAALSLSELTAISGMTEAETLQALYALALGGLLARDGASHALTPDQLARARAVKIAQTRVVPARSDSEDAPPAAAPPAPVVESAPEPPAPESEETIQRNDVYALFARLDDAENHYQVLDLGRDAEAGEIKRAYHALAKRFHPDRFHKNANPALYARVEDTFARISQAYETLKDGRLRTAYDRTLGPPVKMSASQQTQSQQTPGTSSFQADAEKQSAPMSTSRSRPAPPSVAPEELYQQGMAAWQQGNQALALSYLGDAARMSPQQPHYRAHYGRALASSVQMRHQAEAELQAAILLDQKNASYRVMLAKLYSDMGMMRRARGELERALSIDPRHQAARLLLDKLKGKG
jgi:curved DNA-binding protein CbpA